MEIAIHTTGACNLNCKFCAYDFIPCNWSSVHHYTSVKQFKLIVERLAEFGFDEIQLTPTIGEPTMDPTLLEKLSFLEAHDKIKKMTLFTNLTNTEDLQERLMQYRKLCIFVSVYGWDRESFRTITRCDQFDSFERSLDSLMKHYTPEFRSLTFFIRNRSWDRVRLTNTVKQKIKLIVNAKSKGRSFFDRNNLTKMYWNGNWCGLDSDDTISDVRWDRKDGICQFALAGNIVDQNGDVCLCGSCDVLRITNIGNVFRDDLEDLYGPDGKFASILRGQQNGMFSGSCKLCSEHHPLDEEVSRQYEEKMTWLKGILAER
jgi:MoaA/NifB/PqqE/SkfB family radical SAM enzyme